MTESKKTKVQAIREKLANLTEEEKQAFINRGMIATPEGHVLSAHNTIMLYAQSTEFTPSVVAGYRQWRKAGRQVKEGEHGLLIWVPAKKKEKDVSLDVEKELEELSFDPPEDTETEKKPKRNFYLVNVFDISQTSKNE